MIIIYWVFLIISGIYLLSSLIGSGDDGDMDFDQGGDLDGDADDGTDSTKIFSFRVLSGGFMGFAIGGMASLYNDHSLGWQFLTGFTVAIGFGALSFYLSKFMYSMQGNSNFSMSTLKGKIGLISIGSTETGIAQVRLETSDGVREYTCVPFDKNEKFEVGELVKIEEQVGTRFIVSKAKAQ